MPQAYDLVDRTTRFARSVVHLAKTAPRTVENQEFVRQLLRSSASVGANYIEANDALGKRDFIMKIKIARREANESRYWLQLISCSPQQEDARACLIDEATQLAKILSAIASKVQGKR